ncbi:MULTISPECIES: MFS transporter [unclassified Luteibacter]|uniref:MFS transporter n=1 Tax=unclassified Luteibacter TaxID=2620188 RepID=UPI0008BDE9CC|nr:MULTISPECIES: MFS transporter [unclassified Luteibacter]SEO60917.1 MFS transporter, SHS family, lactate transporter [Luteibacter sp. UNC138MFCol5.1]SEV86007.1 MFS transporter, SHS family, lactate transporter [Luteibacter sp. 329MFSha]
MPLPAALRDLDHTQRHTVIASFLGWTLDAFDYFLLTFVILAVAAEFHVPRQEVTYGLFLTLAARPIGALIFGRLADRYGRRPVLMFDIVLFSVLEVLCAFAPSLGILLGLRFLFGIAMGGEWGIGASLAMESIPAKSRGFVSGLLQSGYPCGFFLAALANWLLVDHIGWRGLFVVGALPALLVLYIRRKVPESPVWEGRRAHARESVFVSMRGHWKLFVYLMLLMAAFNMFSHGSQDMYPTFVQETLKIPAGSGTAFMLTALLNLGALAGGLTFGSLSERIGRRRAIILAALLAIPVIPLWTHGGSLLLLGLGAFLIQVMVQGAWGVVPTHLNELSPDAVRGTLPGFAYQMGNLLAAITATAQTWLADRHGGDFAFAMSTWIAAVAVLLALLTWLGPEARGVGFGKDRGTA